MGQKPGDGPNSNRSIPARVDGSGHCWSGTGAAGRIVFTEFEQIRCEWQAAESLGTRRQSFSNECPEATLVENDLDPATSRSGPDRGGASSQSAAKRSRIVVFIGLALDGKTGRGRSQQSHCDGGRPFAIQAQCDGYNHKTVHHQFGGTGSDCPSASEGPYGTGGDRRGGLRPADARAGHGQHRYQFADYRVVTEEYAGAPFPAWPPKTGWIAGGRTPEK